MSPSAVIVYTTLQRSNSEIKLWFLKPILSACAKVAHSAFFYIKPISNKDSADKKQKRNHL